MRKALITGSFDPITNGHLDLIKRASLLVDELIILIAYNPEKKTMFNLEERRLMIGDATYDLANVTVMSSEKLVVEFCEENNVNVLFRGLRNSSDFEYESTMAKYNYELNHTIETVCLVSKPELAYISSSGVKQLIKFNRAYEQLVPKSVVKVIKEKYEDL